MSLPSLSLVILSLDNGILTITMNNGKANALGKEHLAELKEAFAFATKEDAVQGVLLKSNAERIYCAGLDLSQISQFVASDDPVGNFKSFIFDSLSSSCETMLKCPKPVATCVSGHCLAGGLVLALCTDFICWSNSNYLINFKIYFNY